MQQGLAGDTNMREGNDDGIFVQERAFEAVLQPWTRCQNSTRKPEAWPELELGKVFSTLALLGYIFNFSICYSNYAIEALYTLKVYNQRIEAIITGPLSMEDSNKTKWRSSGRDNDARSDYNQSVDKVITTPLLSEEE